MDSIVHLLDYHNLVHQVNEIALVVEGWRYYAAVDGVTVEDDIDLVFVPDPRLIWNYAEPLLPLYDDYLRKMVMVV